MRVVTLVVFVSLFLTSLRSQCDGCERVQTWDPPGPLSFGYTVVYGAGDHGDCDPVQGNPPCEQVVGCTYREITVTLTGLNGTITGQQMTSFNPAVYSDISEGPYVNGKKRWTIGKWQDPLTAYECGFEWMILSMGDDFGTVELNLMCTKCDDPATGG